MFASMNQIPDNIQRILDIENKATFSDPERRLKGHDSLLSEMET